MVKMSSSVVFLVLCIALVSAVKLPETFKRCKVSKKLDKEPNECLRGAIQEAMVQLSVNGSKELGVYDLDPLRIDRVEVEQGGDSPVSIKLVFTEGDLYGFSNITIESVSGKLSSPEKFEMVIDYTAAEVKLLGRYNVEGQILILPIRGDGNSKLILTKGVGKFVIRGEPRNKNGKQYLNVTGYELDLQPSKLFIDLDNLFNGNKALGDNMNRFLNDNWEEVYNELKVTVLEAFGKVLEVYSKRILERVQFKNLFIVE